LADQKAVVASASKLSHFEPDLWQAITKNIVKSKAYMVNGAPLSR
jgi:hypothetical protein